MGASCVRWTADTERAFLLALKATGQVVRAAAAIGRSPSVCYQRRDRFPAFAAAWADTLAEMERERLTEVTDASSVVIDGVTGAIERPALTRARRDGWTQQRQRAFGRALADTGSYGQAAARVGISMTSVQRLRRRSPEFQALCDKALLEGGLTLEEAVEIRAVEGWQEPIFHGGKIVGYRPRFSDGLARTLLAIKVAASTTKVAGGRSITTAAPTPEEVDRALEARLEALHQRLKRQEREEMAAWAEDMRRKGWAP